MPQLEMRLVKMYPGRLLRLDLIHPELIDVGQAWEWGGIQEVEQSRNFNPGVQTVTSGAELLDALDKRYRVVKSNNLSVPGFFHPLGQTLRFEPEQVLLTPFVGDYGVDLGQSYKEAMYGVVEHARLAILYQKLGNYWLQQTRGVINLLAGGAFMTRAILHYGMMRGAELKMHNILLRAEAEGYTLPREVYRVVRLFMDEKRAKGIVPNPEIIEQLIDRLLSRYQWKDPMMELTKDEIEALEAEVGNESHEIGVANYIVDHFINSEPELLLDLD